VSSRKGFGVCDGVWPGGCFVVAGADLEAAVQDADEAARSGVGPARAVLRHVESTFEPLPYDGSGNGTQQVMNAALGGVPRAFVTWSRRSGPAVPGSSPAAATMIRERAVHLVLARLRSS
jgi:hypothetical protein